MEAFKSPGRRQLGDQMLFWRQDGVELCWAFLTQWWRLRELRGAADRLHRTGRAAGPRDAAALAGPPTTAGE